MHNYKKLQVWTRSMEFVYEVYRLTKQFPKEEMYGLTQQLRRSAISVPSNIAEGCGRNTSRDMSHFLSIALGSTFEIETQLLVSRSLGYIDMQIADKLEREIQEIQKMLFAFKEYITQEK